MTQPDGNTYIFDSSGKLSQIQDRNGNSIQLEYTGGNLSQLIHGNGMYISLNYNGSGLLSQIDDFIGNQVTYAYDANKHLSSVTDKTTGLPNTCIQVQRIYEKPTPLQALLIPATSVKTSLTMIEVSSPH